MFDDISFEILIERMLDRVVEQNSNIDIREGSIIYNAVAPAAYELMEVYIEMRSGKLMTAWYFMASFITLELL